jgi:hypothetical protein
MRHRLAAALAAPVMVLAWVAAPGQARASDAWNGAFETSFGFFVGGGAGGGLGSLQLAGESERRWAVTVPLNLRAGFDVGRYGFAVLLDTHYTLAWGPSRDQGPTPIHRRGKLQMLSMLGAVLWRTPSPFYVTAGAGVALTTLGQDLLETPDDARVELMVGIGFLYRFKSKGDNIKHYPFGMSVSLESRYYVPWDERFLHFTLQAVLTLYLVFTGDT